MKWLDEMIALCDKTKHVKCGIVKNFVFLV